MLVLLNVHLITRVFSGRVPPATPALCPVPPWPSVPPGLFLAAQNERERKERTVELERCVFRAHLVGHITLTLLNDSALSSLAKVNLYHFPCLFLLHAHISGYSPQKYIHTNKKVSY